MIKATTYHLPSAAEMGRPQDLSHHAFQRPSRGQTRLRLLLRPTVSTMGRNAAALRNFPTRRLRFIPRAAYDPRLCELSKDLITSFVYSHDLVSRLSLGALRDMSRAAVWLCKAEAEGRPEGYTGITRRALRHKMGFGSRDDPIWVRVLLDAASFCPRNISLGVQFLSIRKTLEANMPLHNLYPPGRVLWAVRDSDVSYAAPPPAEGRYSPMEALRAQ